MNKPVYLGQAITSKTGLSKTLMYEFHYDYMQPKYGSKVKLSSMDTDCVVYEIETEQGLQIRLRQSSVKKAPTN